MNFTRLLFVFDRLYVERRETHVLVLFSLAAFNSVVIVVNQPNFFSTSFFFVIQHFTMWDVPSTQTLDRCPTSS